MHKIITLGIFILALPAVILSQTAVLSAGGDSSTNGQSISYSVGQVVYEFSASTAGSQNQGVQQTYPELEISVSEQSEGLEIALYPNPSRSTTTLELPQDGADYRGELFNLSGQLIRSFRPQAGRNEIDLSNLSSGQYHLRIYRNDSFGASFKVVRVD